MPAIDRACWDLLTQVRLQCYFTDRQVLVRGKTVKRGERKFVDYILFHKPNLPLAIIEAKDNNNSVGAGMQQALAYAEDLDVPFAFSSNGEGFLFHDRLATSGNIERQLALDEFPSPAELWQRYCTAKGLGPAEILAVTQDYFSDGSRPPPGPRTHVVADVTVTVPAERVQYFGTDGKRITESLTDYTSTQVFTEYATLNEFLQEWSSAEQKQAIVAELEDRGDFFAELAEPVGKDLDPFDLVCRVAFGQPLLTRHERANNVKKRNDFTNCGEQGRAVLLSLLDKYADEGLEPIESMGVLRVEPLSRVGTVIEIVDLFGGKESYVRALQELEAAIYVQAN